MFSSFFRGITSFLRYVSKKGLISKYSICIIALIRIAYYNLLNSQDLTHDTVLLFICTAIEPLLGIVLASLPFVRPAGLKILESFMMSWLLSSNRATNNDDSEQNGPSSSFKNSHSRGIGTDRKFSRLHRGKDAGPDLNGMEIDTYPLKASTASAAERGL